MHSPDLLHNVGGNPAAANQLCFRKTPSRRLGLTAWLSAIDQSVPEYRRGVSCDCSRRQRFPSAFEIELCTVKQALPSYPLYCVRDPPCPKRDSQCRLLAELGPPQVKQSRKPKKWSTRQNRTYQWFPGGNNSLLRRTSDLLRTNRTCRK